jgi:hypothetical protein
VIPVARKLLIAEGRAPADHRIGVRLRQHRSGEIRPVAGEWHPRMPERLDQEELVDWRASRSGDCARARRLEADLAQALRYRAPHGCHQGQLKGRRLWANLAPAFLQQIVRKYEGTRLGRQELNAEILDDVPGALWSRALIEETRWPVHRNIPDLVRIEGAYFPATVYLSSQTVDKS